MGWVSTSEDIEERRLENEVRRGFDDLIKKARKANSFTALQREQEKLENLSGRLVDYLENKKAEALKAFHEATKIFREPHVRIMSRLNKKESQLQETREKLVAAEANLAKSRAKRDELDGMLKSMRQENTKLQRTIEQLKFKLDWLEETKTVRPLRKKA